MDILLVEDNADDVQFLSTCIERSGTENISLTVHQTISAACSELATSRFDVALVDLNLSKVSASQCIDAIKNVDPDVPIVVLSSEGDEDSALGALSSGVQDYLVKWEGDGRTVLRSIRYAIERKKSDIKLNYLARFDVLTDIPNRQYLQEQLERATNRARRAGKIVGLLFLDIDRFKVINDTLGHPAGDQLLCAVVQRLQSCIRAGDLLARLGGDEFAILVEDVGDVIELGSVARKLLALFEEPFDIASSPISVTASIGITAFPSDHSDTAGLLNSADIAMYQAKDRGRNRYEFYTQAMQDSILKYHRVASDLQAALQEEQFRLVYQPQVSLSDGVVHSLEALLRWKHPERGLMPPNEFIAVAEDSGHIVPIGRWVLDRVCQQLNEWNNLGLPCPRVSINVSPMHFHQANFVEQICRIVRRHGIDPSQIELELTERSLMTDTIAMRQCLNELRALGFRIAIDDFGTGYSCLSYLSRFPIDVLKIDKSFVSDLSENPDGMAICGVIVTIAKQLNLDCVAEGVEEQRQVEVLQSLGCEYGQGYLFCRPVDPQQIALHVLPLAIDGRPDTELADEVVEREIA